MLLISNSYALVLEIQQAVGCLYLPVLRSYLGLFFTVEEAKARMLAGR